MPITDDMVEKAFTEHHKLFWDCNPDRVAIRAALEAVYPVIRNQVIEECAALFGPREDERRAFYGPQMAAAIRALKTKETETKE